MVNISIVPEAIGHIGSLPITNTLLTSWLVVAALSVGAILFKKTLREIPGKLQSAVEIFFETLIDFFESVAGGRAEAERFLPIVGTIFIFVLTANWAGLIPGLGAIGLHESDGAFVPLFRSVNSDLNMTLALAIIAVTLSHIFGIIFVGMKHHLGKFISFKSPITFFVGILELVSEFAKILSFTFRLFGNVFAGEVLLTIVAFLVPYLAPVPFLGLELFVGVIQALIFATLALVALSANTVKTGH